MLVVGPWQETTGTGITGITGTSTGITGTLTGITGIPGTITGTIIAHQVGQ